MAGAVSAGRCVMKTLARFVACEAGATAVEYSLIAGLIAIGIIAAVQSVGISLQVPFQQIDEGFKQGN